MPEAKGTFQIKTWEGETYEEAEGAVLSKASLTKEFEGDFTGTSSAELLLAEAHGARAYVGMERIDGTLDGATGTFVVQHWALSSKDGDKLTVNVVPGSGTAALEGITGTMEISVDEGGGHHYSLSYDL
ncbi:MAG TPA: DUF3224 domain-containing protein [Actinomycetota bacterium]|nr:DUF3224 domain-containing protein [Actinomycetota bacterium]